jgi:hypothetical protein
MSRVLAHSVRSLIGKLKSRYEDTVNRCRATARTGARTITEETGLSQNAIARIWRAFGSKPHRVENFKFSKRSGAPFKARHPRYQLQVTSTSGSWLNPFAAKNAAAQHMAQDSTNGTSTVRLFSGLLSVLCSVLY